MIGPRASRHGRLAGALIAVATGIGAFGAGAAGAETYVVKGGENAITGTAELVSAVAKANAHAGANTIVLGSGSYLPAKPIKLTNTSGPQTIEGPAGTPTTKTQQADLNGSSEEPIGELILVEAGVTANFKNLEISGQGGEGFSAIEIVGANQATSTAGGNVTIEDSTLANTGPSISVGGGATLTLVNATVSDGRADGVVINEGKATILNSTIFDNKGTGVNNNGGEVTLTNSIVAKNQSGDCIGPIVADHSLDSDGSCEVGALSSKNPDLGSSLAIIGGSTPLHAVKAGSPAINAGDPAACPATDQRGAPRPGIKGDACTLGADEYSSTPPVVKVPPTVTVSAESAAGAIVDYEASAEGVDDGITSFSCNDPTASTFPVGETTVTCTAVDGHENKTTVQFTVIVTSGTTSTSTTTSTSESTTSSSTSTSTSTTTEAPSTTTTTSTTESPSTSTSTSTSETTTSSTSTTTSEAPSTSTSESTTSSSESSTSTSESSTSTTTSTSESPSTSSTTTTTTTTSAAPVAPTVLTLPTSAVSAGGATLTGQVNPNGYEVTTCLIEYGTSTAYGKSAPCSPAPGAGTSVVSVEAVITGLAPDTLYDYRVTATNAGGTVEGENLTFKTEEAVTTTSTSTTETSTTSEPPTTSSTSTSTTTSEPPLTTTETSTTSTETSTSTEPTTSTSTTSPTTTTTTTSTPTTSTTTTTTTTTTSEEVPPATSAVALLEQLQQGVEGAPIPRHLRRELAGLLYDARVTLQTPRPWFFPFPQLWQQLVRWQADGDLHVFVAVIEQDQLSHHDQIPPQLAEIGIQLAQNIEALLNTHPGHIGLF